MIIELWEKSFNTTTFNLDRVYRATYNKAKPTKRTKYACLYSHQGEAKMVSSPQLSPGK